MSTYTTRAQPTVAASIQTHRNSIHHETHTVDLSRKALSLLFPSPYMASPPHSESPFRLFEDTKRLPSASNAHARSWVPHMQVRAPAPHAESTGDIAARGIYRAPTHAQLRIRSATTQKCADAPRVARFSTPVK